MAQENIKITLPQSGLECELLPYVKHKLARAVNRQLFGDETVEVNITDNVDEGSQDAEKEFNHLATDKIAVKLTNMTDIAEIKVIGLLEKLGNKHRNEITEDDIDDLPQKDYNELVKKVNEIFDEAEEKSSRKKS